ncbi:SRPBCC family protein [Isoptericola sp. b408]|uniref:SRPBCC family protein n=1 Tax=Isoptericola sp. b408 TaxID=3064653 RepID=UPI0027141ADC|nr:SRPBCC family protein [Isoptericola sp. b408]MDO8152634.1 SRPBCC family protein [Isoptericola sp. b408]
MRTRVQQSIHIDATPGRAYAYCLDPEQLFAGDPKHVVESSTSPDGVGTTARLSRSAGVMEEDDRLEYVEVVPDERIDIAMQPTMSFSRWEHPRHETALYTLSHVFEPERGGTRMTLTVMVHDPPLYERLIDRFEGRGPDRLVHDRLQRIKEAVESGTATA